MATAPEPSEQHDTLRAHAKAFAIDFCAEEHPELLGITDGKAVGTYIESRFKTALRNHGFLVEPEDEGSAAKGIDLPGLQTDIKVTSEKQPQSSAPFSSFRQKIEGLGYHLIISEGAEVEDIVACWDVQAS